MIWVLVTILLIVLIVSVSRGNKKKKYEVRELKKRALTDKEKEELEDNNIVTQLSKLKALKDEGVLTEEEFQKQKERVLSE